jgi:hypothetical protein
MYVMLTNLSWTSPVVQSPDPIGLISLAGFMRSRWCPGAASLGHLLCQLFTALAHVPACRLPGLAGLAFPAFTVSGHALCQPWFGLGRPEYGGWRRRLELGGRNSRDGLLWSSL